MEPINLEGGNDPGVEKDMLVSDNTRALEVVKALSDEYSRKIVLSIINVAMPIEEISKEQHIPISTCYRRIHELQSYGIVRPDKTIIQPDGKKYVSYKAAFSEAKISLESGELRVDVNQTLNGYDKLHEMWSSVKEPEKQGADLMFSIARARIASGVSKRPQPF
jgi:predicted transcriptional regulator